MSAFHSCVVVDLWQSLSEWHLLLSACVLVCRCENVRACIRARTNITFLVKLGKSGNKIREMLVQVYRDNAQCTMEDCQFPTTKIILSVQIKSQSKTADFF